MKHFLRIISLFLAAVLSLGVVTFCWLAAPDTITFPTAFGSATANYFNGGNGSKEKPYTITTPVHLYNLAWLQYLGYFNLNPALNNSMAQSYFRLDSDLVMTGVVIPPIGTEEYPFIGHFDGNGKTISSLMVSNAEEDLSRRCPDAAVFRDGKLYTAGTGKAEEADNTEKVTEVAIVGLFGVTGDYGDTIDNGKNSYYTAENGVTVYNRGDDGKTLIPTDGKTVGSRDLYYASMYIGNFYADILHVRSASTKTLIGLAAGYVKGAMENIGIYRCDLTLAGGAGHLTDEGNGVVSQYSIVGDYDKNSVGWSEDPGNTGTPSGGAFGNSIDMRTLNRRLTYMYALGTKSGGIGWGSWQLSQSDVFGINLTSTISDRVGYLKEYYWKDENIDTKLAIMYLSDGTILPLNVDKGAMGLASWDSAEDKTEETVGNGTTKIAYHFNQEYAAANTGKTGEILSGSGNTGFIVGDANGDNATVTAVMRKLIDKNSTWYPGIPYSFAGGTLTNGVFDKSLFALYTIRNGETVRIIDSDNLPNKANYTTGSLTIANLDITEEANKNIFKRYSKVRENLNDMFEGTNTYHGIRFNCDYSKAIITDSTTGTVTYQCVDIDSEKVGKDKYYLYPQYIKGGINFRVEKKGYITAVLAGGYNAAIGDPSMFDLYWVERYESGENAGRIKSVKRIDKIYTDKDDNVYYEYVGGEKDTIPEGTEVQEFISLKELANDKVKLMENAAFYFEIPAKAGGNYFISHDYQNDTKMTAYLMYLDIGANGDGGTSGGETQKTPYLMQKVDFINDSWVNADGKVTVPLKDGSETEHVYPAYADAALRLSAPTGNAVIAYKRETGTATNDDGEYTAVLYYHITWNGADFGGVEVAKLPDGTDIVREDPLLFPSDDEDTSG